MKIVILALLVSVAAAAKLDQLEQQVAQQQQQQQQQQQVVQQQQQVVQQQPQGRLDRRPVVAIIKDERVAPAGGIYATEIETEDGVTHVENGQAGSAGQSNVQGSYSYFSPEGELVQVNYVADELGFRAESPFVPTPHPLPAHALQQIAFAEEQLRLRAQGQQL
ncbi:hypothetical protein Pmani_017237 [Petrolisthes manimaculis]|uniref:Uncharacterized protein n=1 Tax=Petrolisthes manimaculis TaxID=1843537 RepID=A0AAE1PN28_9EUCA|nr:hypothetical protein Pmani_017237 [Petrolisthes manimaculis]